MKKYFIGLIIAVVFVAYTFVLRHQHSKPILPPASSSSSPNSNSTSNGSSTANSGSSTTGSTTTPTTTASYKDGQYTGSVANAYYGNVQVAAVISGGKISNVKFLQAPNDNPNSAYINSVAKPYLQQEAIKAQSSNVSIITGATYTSQAFVQSLMSALSQAK